jgi:hypothetical protein
VPATGEPGRHGAGFYGPDLVLVGHLGSSRNVDLKRVIDSTILERVLVLREPAGSENVGSARGAARTPADSA